MDHGPEMNEKINKIKDAEESGAINDIIQYQVRRARTNEEKNQILNDWKMATEQAVLLDVTNEDTKEIALQLDSIIDGLIELINRPSQAPPLRRRRRRSSSRRSRSRSPPAVSPTSRRLRQGVENNHSRSRSPVRHRRTRGHQSTGGKGHRKNKTHKRKRNNKRSKKA